MKKKVLIKKINLSKIRWMKKTILKKFDSLNKDMFKNF